jgi:hypothetical protein
VTKQGDVYTTERLEKLMWSIRPAPVLVVGMMILLTGCGAVSGARSSLPALTPPSMPATTPSPTVFVQPLLTAATVDNVPTDCAKGRYPPIIVTNVGESTLVWSAHDDFGDPIAITPTSGTLTPGQQQSVIVTGAFTPTADHRGITVTITAHTPEDPTNDYGDTLVGFTCGGA